MGANIRIRLRKGTQVEQMIGQIRDALARAGYSNINFNVKKSTISKYQKSPVQIDSGNLHLL